MSSILAILFGAGLWALFMFVMVPVHEAGHLLLAKILHEKVIEVKLFNPQFYKTRRWALGYVRVDHSTSTKRGAYVQSVVYEMSYLCILALVLLPIFTQIMETFFA